MSSQTLSVGQLERATQNRVVALFQKRLGYEYLGNWEDRENNANVEEIYLVPFLKSVGYGDGVIKKSIDTLRDTANRSNASLYDANKETYGLLRYGIKVREGVGENFVTVRPIDWENPERNHFAIADEVKCDILKA